jgi:hypothetical protein
MHDRFLFRLRKEGRVMANRYSVINGDLYANGVVNEMKVSTGLDNGKLSGNQI